MAARTRPALTGHETPAAKPDGLATRLFRFGRAVIVGSGATLVDFSIFTACVRAAGVAPSVARIPALILGASVQFFGNRSFTFRAQSGNLSRQAKLFFAAEAVTFALNWTVFHLLEKNAPEFPPELLGFAGTFLVFIAFAYPVRRLVVFRVGG